jgi:hypothetical protein
VSLPRYALRTAGFAALYLLATWAGLATTESAGGVRLFWPAAVAAALWLVAQAPCGRRNLDVIALSVVAVLAPGSGEGLLHAFVQAVPQVVPAVLFAWLFDRWLPGYWLGHGDRFRRLGRTLARLAGAAALAALAGAVLAKVIDTGLSVPEAGYVILRDATALVLAVLAARGVRHVARRRGPAAPSDDDDSTGDGAGKGGARKEGTLKEGPRKGGSREDAPRKDGRPGLTVVR